MAAISHAGDAGDDEPDRQQSDDRDDRRHDALPVSCVTATSHTASDDGDDDRVQHEHRPAAGGHALAAAEPARRPGTCGRGSPPRRTRSRRVVRRASSPTPGGERSLQRVEHEHQHALAPAEHAGDVRRAGVAGAVRGDVDAARRGDDRRRSGTCRAGTPTGMQRRPHTAGADQRRRRRCTGREWSAARPSGSGRADGRRRAPARRGRSTHSGSGPSSGRPVKNLAAMQPPWQAS